MIDAAHGQKLCGDWISEMSLSNVQTMSCYSYILLGWFHFCLKYIPKNRWIVCLKFIKQLPSNEQFMYQCPLEISSLCFFHDFNLCICFLASLSQYIYIYIILYYSRHWWLRKTLYQQIDHLRRYVLSRRTFGPRLFRESYDEEAISRRRGKVEELLCLGWWGGQQIHPRIGRVVSHS